MPFPLLTKVYAQLPCILKYFTHHLIKISKFLLFYITFLWTFCRMCSGQLSVDQKGDFSFVLRFLSDYS